MARVYKETIKIKHYGNFDKIVNVSKKGLFSVKYPVCVVSDEDINEIGGILQTDECYAQTMKEIEEKFRHYVAEFIALFEEYETVILYKWTKPYRKASGFGFELDWGVFRRLKVSNFSKRYYYVRGQEGVKWKADVHNDSHKDELRKGWKEIKWTEERENFFRKVIGNLENLFAGMDEFFSAANMEDFVDEMANKDKILKLTTNDKIEA